MPELPEVETLVSELKNSLSGLTLSGIEIQNPSILKTPVEEFSNLIDQKIIGIGRRGKYIQVVLSQNQILWIHLGMTGQLLFEKSFSPKPHTHLIFSFEGCDEKLLFCDPRRFGGITLTSGLEVPDGVKRLGREPRDWDRPAFVSLLKERRGRIKNLLLNQTLVAGLGNIYADESLYRAGIRPLHRACRVTRRRLERLHAAVCEILEEAIQAGGSSIDDYVHLDGTAGNFQHLHRVYGRGGENCFHCGTRIRSVKLSGRTSSFCPHCQK